MSNYTKSTNFATKDNLTPGDPLKVVRGTEIDTEFNNIATAVATKTDNASAAITGGTITGITDLAVADGGTGASTAAGGLNNLLPSQTGNASKYLQTDGTNASWDAVSLSTADITGTLPVANGGTGVTSSTGTGNVVLSNSPTLVTPALGTPASGVATNLTGLPISTGVSGLGTGVATFLGTPSSANLISAVTDETGTGSLVFATSPTLVTPALGTPSALVGTNITGTASGLTAGNVTTNANLTGAVTSVGNTTSLGSFSSANLLGALTDETGTGSAVFATSPTLVTPILGTPTSATLTNATGLPIATGVSGLGTGVATFLATPSSANLRSALTDETGTGSAVFATSPTLVTPALGTPSSGVVTNLTGTASININGTVGATTATTGAFTTVSATSTGDFAGILSRTHAQGTNAYITNTTTGKANTVMGFNDSGSTVSGAPTANSYFGTLQNYQLAFISNSALLNTSAYTFHTWNISAAESMRLNATGLGIGTSSPANKLQVEVSSADVEAVLFNNSYTVASARTALRMGYQVAGYGVRIVSEGNASAAYSNSLVFERGIGSSSYSETMRINASGNVGIGTSSPSVRLDVQAAEGRILLTSTTGTNASYFTASNTGGTFNIGRDNSSGGLSGTAYAATLFSTGAYPMVFGTNNTERMRLDSTGNLGIGTASPDANLTVNGAASFAAGTALLPSIARAGDLNTGLWFPAADTIAASTGGSERARIDSSGRVGIATTSPLAPLQINSFGGLDGNGNQFYITNNQYFDSVDARDESIKAGYSNRIVLDNNAGGILFQTTSTSAAGANTAVTLSERARIPAAGGFQSKTTISVGDATPSSSGAGITFPATQSASSDANTLDDYEEGTWTPTVTSLTVVGTPTYTGRYTKIGRMVFFDLQVSSTVSTASTDGVTVFTLPFTQAGDPRSIAMARTASNTSVPCQVLTLYLYTGTWGATATVFISGSYAV